MKKIINKNYKLIIAFILGMIVSGCGVLAATTYAIDSKMVSYTDNSSLGATNVQDAIDKTCSNLDNELTKLTPTEYIVPTIVNGVTDVQGGYFIIGKVVVVDLNLHINTTTLPISNNVNYGTKIFSGLPTPKDGNAVLPVYFTGKDSSGYAMMYSSIAHLKSGDLYFVNNNSQYVSTWGLQISGTYLME